MAMNGGRSLTTTRDKGDSSSQSRSQSSAEPDSEAQRKLMSRNGWWWCHLYLIHTCVFSFHPCFFKDFSSIWLKSFCNNSTLPLPYRVILLLQTGPGWLQAGCESCKSGAGSVTRAVSGPPRSQSRSRHPSQRSVRGDQETKAGCSHHHKIDN